MLRKEAINKLTELAKDRLWGCGEYSEALAMAIQALEQESVLEKIRAELMLIEAMEDAIEIIDKYKAESEYKE